MSLERHAKCRLRPWYSFQRSLICTAIQVPDPHRAPLLRLKSRSSGAPLPLLVVLLLLSGCQGPIAPLDPDPYLGDWRLVVASSNCWNAMEVVFDIRPARIQRWSESSINFDSQWAYASEPAPFRLITGIISRYESDVTPRFSLTLFSLGEVLGIFDGPAPPGETAGTGNFYSINGPSCSSNAVLTGPN